MSDRRFVNELTPVQVCNVQVEWNPPHMTGLTARGCWHKAHVRGGIHNIRLNTQSEVTGVNLVVVGGLLYITGRKVNPKSVLLSTPY